ncbi:hypothetical protein OAK15_00395 [Verrucomicrobia bacterium]|nr:hypothetical protein [Verrucomicrobiota bacterium]
MAPRWTYSEANPTCWGHIFDDFLGGTPSVEVPFEGNGKSLCSLRIRYTTTDSVLRLHLKRPHNYRPIPHLDPALRARLISAPAATRPKAHYPGQNRGSLKPQ